jgi:6-phosphogluconolactonase
MSGGGLLPTELPAHRLWIGESAETVGLEAALRFRLACREAQGLRGRFAVALGAGRVPGLAYAQLAHKSAEWKLDWSHIEVFLLDEHWVSADDPLSHHRMLRQVLLDQVPVPPENVHPVQTDAPDLPDACRAMHQVLAERLAPAPEELPCLDMVILSMGNDAHVASIYPHSPLLQAELDDSRWVLPAREPSGRWRITLTLPVINAARRVLVLACGNDRSRVLGRVLKGQLQPIDLPAQAIQMRNRGEVEWLVDRAALTETSSRETAAVEVPDWLAKGDKL